MSLINFTQPFSVTLMSYLNDSINEHTFHLTFIFLELAVIVGAIMSLARLCVFSFNETDE